MNLIIFPFIFSIVFASEGTEMKLRPRLWLKNATQMEFWHREYGYVYYDITPHIPRVIERLITDQIRYLNSLTCVKWWPVYPWEDAQHKVTFLYDFEGPNCYFEPEVNGDRQQIIRLSQECIYLLRGTEGRGTEGIRFIIMHMMMRAMGMYPENQRANRDCYLDVPPLSSEEVSYRILKDQNYFSDFPFDYYSIMMIPDWINPGVQRLSSNRSVGRRSGSLSKTDILKLEHMACGGPSYCQSEEAGPYREDGWRENCYQIKTEEAKISWPCRANPLLNKPPPTYDPGYIDPGRWYPESPKIPQGVCRRPG